MPESRELVAGASSDFPEGQIVAREISGRSLIFIRRLGRVSCYLDECTHQPVKLSEFGEVRGGRLVCHAHGGGFDLDNQGVVFCGPPESPLYSVACREDSGQVSVMI